jgi:hypothetical protein
MTEAQWLACDEPEEMLRWLEGRASARKLRLFACACCRRVWHLMDDPRSRSAVEVAERLADGLAARGEIEAAKVAARGACGDAHAYTAVPGPDGWQSNYYTPPVQAARAAYHAVAGSRLSPHFAASAALDAVAYTGEPVRAPVRPTRASFPPTAEPAGQCALLRDLFGHLHRPAARLEAEPPGWGGTAVRMVAQGIYGDRAFDHLPVLADALEDAGCADAELLGHLRSPGPHVRGCWALDLILGKG